MWKYNNENMGHVTGKPDLIAREHLICKHPAYLLSGKYAS